jgi:predicted kinase
MEAMSKSAALAALRPDPGLIVLLCGVAGSGKTTFSQALEAKGFIRIAIDEEIWRTSGRYGLDYAPDEYGAKVAAARIAIRAQLEAQLARRTAVVIDSSFWSRAHRKDFTELVERFGGHRQLVYLKAGEDLLRSRLASRRGRFDANAALPIDNQTLVGFLQTFEEPGVEEDALVVGA